MKRIIAPFALSLLAVSTLATAGYTEAEAAQMAMDKIKAETKIDNIDDFNRKLIEINYKAERDALKRERDKLLESDKLSPWTTVYYRDFNIKSILFDTMEDCITAKEYAVKHLGGVLVQPSSNSIPENFTTIGYKLVGNIETRITCRQYINKSRLFSLKRKFELNYNTAYKLSDAELEADRLANTRSNELQADRVKKQMVDFLNE